MKQNEKKKRTGEDIFSNNRMLNLVSSKYTRKKYIGNILIEEMENCVYFISDGEYIKIGSASSLPNRMKQLQTGNARKLKALYVIPCKNQAESLKIEKVLHKRLEEDNVLGEWFRINDDKIRSVVFDLDYKLRYPTSKFNFDVDGINIVS